MVKILITAFDAFGQDSLNASFELLKALPNKINDKEIIKLQIPTIRYRSFETIQQFLKTEKVDYILALGQAGNTRHLRFEKVAINLDDFRIKDNANQQPIDEKIIEDGENAYFCSLPLKSYLSLLQEKNIPAQMSYSAGTFVCNHVMYQLLHHYPNSGFIHVPQIESENTIGLPLSIMVEGICTVIENIDMHEIQVVGGEIQ